MKTPKKIWQTWKSKKEEDVPEKLSSYSGKWKKLHPDYEYHLLDDEDLRNKVKDIVPEYLDLYDSFSKIIEKVDFARYAILYGYGGIYADMDTYPIKPADIWVNKNKVVLGCEPKEHAENIYGRDRVVCNALMISPPGERFWYDLMRYIVENYERNYRPVENTGPLAITRFLETPEGKVYISKIEITDPCVFYPLKGDNTVSEECNLKESYVAHVWENTWVVPWYKDPILFNARYWTYGLLVIFTCLWYWCYLNKI